ncbi:hypothetical protein [Microbacterium sp.]|uniref:hypothetical protein n=1 Tax=Microbacterium sp. TaxID=51671 RepID=UPI0028B22D3E|nr:hypothetical protein [Microbacterium sp.]
MRSSGRSRLLRGFAGASVSTFVALASHVGVGGQMPGMLGIAVPWLLSFMVCTLLSGIRLSAIRLTFSVMVSQALFHVLFVLGAITPRGGIAPHVHGPLTLPAGSAVLVPEDAGMWVAHGVAAMITVIALHRGERLIQTLIALASAVVRWLTRAVAIAPALPAIPTRPRWVALTAPRRTDQQLSPLRRRGPPLRVV